MKTKIIAKRMPVLWGVFGCIIVFLFQALATVNTLLNLDSRIAEIKDIFRDSFKGFNISTDQLERFAERFTLIVTVSAMAVVFLLTIIPLIMFIKNSKKPMGKAYAVVFLIFNSLDVIGTFSIIESVRNVFTDNDPKIFSLIYDLGSYIGSVMIFIACILILAAHSKEKARLKSQMWNQYYPYPQPPSALVPPAASQYATDMPVTPSPAPAAAPQQEEPYVPSEPASSEVNEQVPSASYTEQAPVEQEPDEIAPTVKTFSTEEISEFEEKASETGEDITGEGK